MNHALKATAHENKIRRVANFYSAAAHRSRGALWPSFAPARIYADLPTTVSELAAVGNGGDSQYEDSGRWFVKRGGKLLFAKGRHCGESLDEVVQAGDGYLEWMQGLDDLPSDTAQCLVGVLCGVAEKNLPKSDNVF